MKQSAVKTLGVAALGAAFAAAGAGAANAAPAVPDPTGTVGTVTSLLPTGEAAQTLPAGGLNTAQPATEGVLPADPAALAADPTTLPADPAAPVTDLAGTAPGTELIGGMPPQLPAGLPGLPAV